MIRFSKYSLFGVQYAIISIIIIVWLLLNKKMSINPTVLMGMQLYEAYFIIFWARYAWLKEIRFATYWGYMIPWINLYRLPTMIMMLLAVSQIKALDYGIE